MALEPSPNTMRLRLEIAVAVFLAGYGFLPWLWHHLPGTHLHFR